MASAVSVERKSPYYTQGKCFNDCEATLFVGEEKTELYVCMDQLAKLSEYFRVMFFGDFKEKNQKQFEIKDEKPEDLICFFNTFDPNPVYNKLTGNSVLLLIRLADKFQCDLLKERLKNYIAANEPKCKIAKTILNWLLYSLHYHLAEETVKICLPGVSCLPLSILRDSKVELGADLYIKLVEAKFKVLLKAAK